jgi:hypothetical protein
LSRFNPDDTIREYELEHGIEATKTVIADEKEFSKKSKGSFDTYVEKLDSQSFAKDFVFDIALPAHSSNGKESCGKRKAVGCLNHKLHKSGCGFCKKAIMSCNSKGCRVCYVSAIKREAVSIADRMLTFANLKNNRKIYLKGNRSRILQHVIVSPPDTEYYKMQTPESRKELRKKQIKILKLLDIDGGVTITHPYRFGDNLEYARHSPHFHNIITGWLEPELIRKINDGEEKRITSFYKKSLNVTFESEYDYSEFKDWNIVVVKNPDGTRRVFDNQKDCYVLAKYLLSHTAVYEKEAGKRSSDHSVSYFGECQNRFFKVDRILKNSVTGYKQLNDILEAKLNTVKKKYSLQSIDYTFSTIPENCTLISKESTNDFHTINVARGKITKGLDYYITPKKNRSLDNPAETQCDSLEFLQMRFDYGDSFSNIVQSEYFTVILDPDLSQLCPEDSSKMRTLTPSMNWSDQQKNKFQKFFTKLQENTITQFDNSQFNLEYLESKHMDLGMPYFNDKGELLHETGIYSKPDCLDNLNPTLYHRISKNITEQKFKYQFKIENGRVPTRTELEESLYVSTIPNRPTAEHTQKLTNFV